MDSKRRIRIGTLKSLSLPPMCPFRLSRTCSLNNHVTHVSTAASCFWRRFFVFPASGEADALFSNLNRSRVLRIILAQGPVFFRNMSRASESKVRSKSLALSARCLQLQVDREGDYSRRRPGTPLCDGRRCAEPDWAGEAQPDDQGGEHRSPHCSRSVSFVEVKHTV
jgi:hypothetical protein